MTNTEDILDGAAELQKQIDITCSLIASDLEKINNGHADDLKILCTGDDILKKLLFVIKNKDGFMGKAPKIGRPPKFQNTEKELSLTSDTEKITGEDDVNPFELVSKKVRQKLNGNRQ